MVGGASAGECDQLCAEPWGVCPAACLVSVSAPTWDAWEGAAWAGKQPPRAGPCLVTGERLVPARDTQCTKPGHCHGPGQLWGWWPHVPQPSSLDFAHAVPVQSSYSGTIGAPGFCQRLSNRETSEKRQGACRYPLNPSSRLSHRQGSVCLPHSHAYSNLYQIYFAVSVFVNNILIVLLF